MSDQPNHLPRIAWLSPFPPQRSGIANYSYWLIKELRSSFEIGLFYEGEPPSAELQEIFKAKPVATFAEQYETYDHVIYHLGNNREFHKRIYELAWEFPGIVVLHDYDLNAFMHDAFFRENYSLYRQAMPNGSDGEGPNGLHALIQRFIPPTKRHPMSHAVVSRSKKVIVHHRWVKDQFNDNEHVQVIPHFAKLNCEPTAEDLNTFREKLGIRDEDFVLTCLGFINPNKLPQLQIDVVKRLLLEGYPVKLLFAGEPALELKGLASEIQASEFREHIILTGYQNDLDYFSSLFVADVVINLRNPSMGEASGTLMHALAAGKPTIISDTNQYREFPDKVCWKVAHDEDQAEVLFEYLKALLSDRNLRTAISANAAEYVKTVLALEKIKEHWADSILR